MLTLKDVVLVMIETRCHELARKALEDTLKVASFKKVLIFTNKPFEIPISGADYILVDDWDDKLGWCKCFWHTLPKYIRTNETILLIQWDSWAIDASMWNVDYLKYDYVGAPWPEGVVGNSGFSLRSGHLAHFLNAQKDKFPVIHSNEDVLASRTYRSKLEKSGYTWAPKDLALDFSFECVKRSPTSKHFGFHGIFNWSQVLDPDQYKERIDLVKKNQYIPKEMMQQLGRTPFFVDGTDENGKWLLG